MRNEGEERFCIVFQPAVAAHRGASRRYPENTLAAVKEAINIAMVHPKIRFFIEVDVRSSVDGKLVLVHDASVTRTTFGTGQVGEMTWAAIQALTVRPVSTIVQGGQVSEERVRNPYFPITEADMRIASLEEVLVVVREANRVRAEIGSPIGLSIEIKPLVPTGPFFPTVMGLLLGIASGLLDKIGLVRVADHLQPPTPSVGILANMLNELSEGSDKTPLLVFSAAGGIGRRNLVKLWEGLTPDARSHFFHSPRSLRASGQRPYVGDQQAQRLAGSVAYPVQLGEVSAEKPFTKAFRTLAGFTNLFWVIGSLKPVTQVAKCRQPPETRLVSTLNPLNELSYIEEAVNTDVTIIASDYPDRVIDVVEKRTQSMSPQDMTPCRSVEILRGSRLADREIERRLRLTDIECAP